MPQFKSSKRISVAPDLAFAVAADVGAYQSFLPLLQQSRIIGAKQATTSGESFEAELTVSYPKLGLREAFVSKVETDHLVRRVVAKSQDGPFRNIETSWHIAPAANGSEVSIFIDYAFRNPLLQIAAAGLMDMAIAKVMTAFEARAKLLQTQSKTS